MSVREQIIKETEDTSDIILSEVLEYLQYLKVKHQRKIPETALMTELVLKNDWLLPEEDAAWQDL